MNYRFTARVIVEPIQLDRIEREERYEDSLNFSHHLDPLRQRHDEMIITCEIESPSPMTEPQHKAFEKALKRMISRFRLYVAEEFDNIS